MKQRMDLLLARREEHHTMEVRLFVRRLIIQHSRRRISGIYNLDAHKRCVCSENDAGANFLRLEVRRDFGSVLTMPGHGG
jgi:hypothetical protein